MASYSEKELIEANRIIESFFYQEKIGIDIDSSIVVSDIESDATEFKAELAILDNIGSNMPAIRFKDDSLVPIALSIIAGGIWPEMNMLNNWKFNPFVHEYLYMLFKNHEQFSPFESISLDQARKTFISRATDFLAVRIAAIRGLERSQSSQWSTISTLKMIQRSGGSNVATPGCQFTVSTDSRGLRVFWSGAYRVSPNYFGHPTTPTIGVLQSGTYIFGVDGCAYGNQIQWDINAVVTLPGNANTHLNY